ncbi:hypothetical protein I8752_24495 [Nostocaceae cyanobacterium CENA369]|uniref:Uncharacterized protein n=1 Tax=Dendronalium phyllosphericum CENA369 TaxID=1725256 RepID=A0A8J7IB72_9NOST|nr:hypothetical protein [Dendronalium phyllosphericum]MBH8576095.1 hypothetical protein [Dendronalium phyllosphericum CENA369]
MSQYENNENYGNPGQNNLVSPMDLLVNETWLRQAVEAEELACSNIGAGLNWGSAFGDLILNFELLGRLTILRISLNKEVRLLISDWNLGTATKIAVKTARERIVEKLRLPTPEVRQHILVTLGNDELYGEEFISNRKILRELLDLLLTPQDWETIAAVAADSLKQQIIYQAVGEKISA